MNKSLNLLIQKLAQLTDMTTDEVAQGIESPPSPELGDYAFACFPLAKTLRKSPNQIAQDIAEKIAGELPGAGGADGPISAVSSAGPYVNFSMVRSSMTGEILGKIFSKTSAYGSSDVGNGQTVLVEYSSPNVAKRFHVGHLSSTIIGGALANIVEFLGYKTIRLNHLGDWGTQFGKIIVAYRRWGDEAALNEHPIEHLESIYVKFHQVAESEPGLEDEARLWSKRLEDGDAEARKLWQKFRDESITELERIYLRLGVRFDSFDGEAFYEPMLEASVERVETVGLLKESQGAMIVEFPEDANMPPMLLKRSDGGTLYATRDLAALFYRRETYNFDKCLYVVGRDQELHFRQLFTALNQMGETWVERCVHVPFGRVHGMSTRKGNVVLIDELLDRAVDQVQNTMGENPEQFAGIENPQQVAEEVGVGGIIFGTLSHRRGKDVDFDWDRALNFNGETGPYLQYTHARMSSILRKAAEADPKRIATLASLRENSADLIAENIEIEKICSDTEWAVVMQLDRFASQVQAASDQYDPSFVASYLIDLATAANRFHSECRVINPEDESLTLARLAITECIRQVLFSGLALLCLKAPERM